MESKTKGIVVGIGSVVVAIGLGIFYLMFFKLAPYIGSCIPDGEWHKFMVIGVYIFVGWAGGIVIPLVFIILGIGFIVHMFTN